MFGPNQNTMFIIAELSGNSWGKNLTLGQTNDWQKRLKWKRNAIKLQTLTQQTSMTLDNWILPTLSLRKVAVWWAGEKRSIFNGEGCQSPPYELAIVLLFALANSLGIAAFSSPFE